MNDIRDLFPGRMRERTFQLKAKRDAGAVGGGREGGGAHPAGASTVSASCTAATPSPGGSAAGSCWARTAASGRGLPTLLPRGGLSA